MSTLLAFREAEQFVRVSMLLVEGTFVHITEKERDDTNTKIFNAVKDFLGNRIESLSTFEDLWDSTLNDKDGVYELTFSAKLLISGDYDPDNDIFTPTDGFLDDYFDNKIFREKLRDLPIAKYIDFSTISIDIDEDSLIYGDYVDFA